MSDTQTQLQVSSLYIKHFRCFDTLSIDLNSSIVLIYGSNGIGKTSLLEALYYACYLRSFRTNSVHDLINAHKESFFIKLTIHNSLLNDSLDNVINVGYSNNKRLVKINNTTAVSYKNLLSYYRVVSLTEDDLLLIKGSPEERRSFIDKVLLLQNPHFITKIKRFKSILESRNALLLEASCNKENYDIWTQKLWESSYELQLMRKDALRSLEVEINLMLADYSKNDLFLSFVYRAKKLSDRSFEDFLNKNSQLFDDERYFKRSLFGIHLDDFDIVLSGKKSRVYASRGQQKMILLLIKAAQIRHLTKNGNNVIFLLDDFMTDFDVDYSSFLFTVLLSLNCQLIFTSPHINSPLEVVIKESLRSYKIVTM